MKKIVLSFSFLLFVNFCVAQVAIFTSTYFVDSVSQPGLKKYGLKLSFDGINVPVIFETYSTMDNTVFYGDSVPNIFNSGVALNNQNSSIFISTAKNSNNTNEILGELVIFPMSKNLISFPQINSSTGTNCDGEIQISIDTLGTYIMGCGVEYAIIGAVGSNSLAVNNQTISALCSNKYRISVGCAYYLNDTSIASQQDAIVLLGQYAFPSTTGLNIDVNTYKDATSPACDGKARVSILNSSLPFLCAFDGGGYSSSDSITNLCEGIHSVLVATVNDTVGKYFVVTDIGNVINNPNGNGIVVDTIVYNYTNCNFNYNLPVDSAFLLSYAVIDSNTVFFAWQIWQLGVSISISDTMSFVYQTGNNMISLNIFCGSAKSTNATSFKTFRINDYAYLSNTATAIKDKQNNSNFELYPNPFSSSISIKAKDKLIIKNIELYNVLGEKIAMSYKSNSQEIVLDTDHLKSGFYTISVVSQSGQKNTYKVIKQ